MLYEIVFYGGNGCADTVLITRAQDHRAALALAANPPKALGQALPPPDVVYEMGSDNSPDANTPNILFGHSPNGEHGAMDGDDGNQSFWRWKQKR